MKLLPSKFVKKGFKHTLVKREDSVAIFKRQSVESNNIIHYEVVVITSHNGTVIEGNFIEPGELYPSTSQWGDKGWTCCSLERAEKKFLEVKKRLKNLEAKAAIKKNKKKSTK